MTARLELLPKRFPEVFAAMFGLNTALEKSGLEHSLLLLIKMRVSQINGCGYCIDMHTKDARLLGETEQRLHLLTVWREAPMYSDRERAALAWAEAVTLLQDREVADEVYAQVREQFNEEEIVALTLAVVAINGWNRFSIAFKRVPGDYVAGSLLKKSA